MLVGRVLEQAFRPDSGKNSIILTFSSDFTKSDYLSILLFVIGANLGLYRSSSPGKERRSRRSRSGIRIMRDDDAIDQSDIVGAFLDHSDPVLHFRGSFNSMEI